MASTPKRRGGPVKRDTTAVILRIAPDLADWYAQAAERQGGSRNRFMERWLEVLYTIMKEMEKWKGHGLSPTTAVQVVGRHLVGEMIRLGVPNNLLKEAWDVDTKQWNAEEKAIRKDKPKLAKSKVGTW